MENGLCYYLVRYLEFKVLVVDKPALALGKYISPWKIPKTTILRSTARILLEMGSIFRAINGGFIALSANFTKLV